MSPGEFCYFDHYQNNPATEPIAFGGYTSAEKVYSFNPIPEKLKDDEKKYILGAQANLWSEYILDFKQVEYMIFPRLAALSETLWSPKESRNWEDFSTRIEKMFKRYDFLGINYAKSAYLVMHDVQIDMKTKEVSLALKNEFTNADIRYTLGDKKLTFQATKYTEPLKIDKTTTVNASLLYMFP